MEKSNILQQKEYEAPLLITMEVAVENGFGASVKPLEDETYE